MQRLAAVALSTHVRYPAQILGGKPPPAAVKPQLCPVVLALVLNFLLPHIEMA